MNSQMNSQLSKVSGKNTSLKSTALLLIDNYDSFTFNLLQYFGELGATCTVVRNDEITVDEIGARCDDGAYSGIILSPGPCSPKEAGVCVPLVRALSGTLPILGVCLGHQSIAAAFGATIIRAKSLMHGKQSHMIHDSSADGLFNGLPSPVVFGRYHSLAIDASSLPPSIIVDARAEHDQEIMSIRHCDHPTFGVQFHPESILSPHGKTLLANFLALTSECLTS